MSFEIIINIFIIWYCTGILTAISILISDYFDSTATIKISIADIFIIAIYGFTGPIVPIMMIVQLLIKKQIFTTPIIVIKRKKNKVEKYGNS